MSLVASGSTFRGRWLLLIGAATLVGCSDTGLVQVAGDVTVGDEKVVQGTIGFFPDDGQGPSAEAVIDEGHYSVELPPGKKKIVIHGYRQVGEKFPWGKGAQSMPVLEEIVPAEFNSDSTLTADVQDNKSDLHFKLTAPIEAAK